MAQLINFSRIVTRRVRLASLVDIGSWSKKPAARYGVHSAISAQGCRVFSDHSAGQLYGSEGGGPSRHKKLHNRQSNEIAQGAISWAAVQQDNQTDDTFGILQDEDSTSGHNSANHKPKRRGRDRKASKAEWGSTFGTLAEEELREEFRDQKLSERHYSDDEGELDESEQPYRRLSTEGRKHHPDWYARQIEKLSKQGKVSQAIHLLETTMLKEDRVRPNQYVFTALIGALGRVGYTRKAFQLFSKMKNFGLQPEDPTYTALFNACSNSPWKADGLQRAEKLRSQMSRDGYEPNLITYKAMIKAYAMCDAFETAFAIADELQSRRLSTDDEVFSFLLMACVADKEAGLRHAIQVWRLRARRTVPATIYHYNLLLRAVKECGIGDPQLAKHLLQVSPPKSSGQRPEAQLSAPEMTSLNEQEERTARDQLVLHPVEELRHGDEEHVIAEVTDSDYNRNNSLASVSQTLPVQRETVTGSDLDMTSSASMPAKSWWEFESSSSSSLVKRSPGAVASSGKQSLGLSVLDMDVPNILDPFADLGCLVSLGDVKTREARLALIGGVPGVLGRMKDDAVEPDIKTFAQLITLLPPSRDAEMDLLAAMTLRNINPDTDILNMMIRRRNRRHDPKGARAVLDLMVHFGCAPNPMTYNCLALGCPKKADGLQLIRDMERSGTTPTEELFRSLLARSYYDFGYKLQLLHNMRRLEVAPTPVSLKRLDESVTKGRKALVDAEKGRDVPEFFHSDYFREGFREFMLQYKTWLLDMKLDIPPHPWDQYKAAPPDSRDSPPGESIVRTVPD